jgi:hypothetical protein
MEFLDPRIVELITYVDPDGKKRVKPPYKNKRVYSVISNSITPEGHFIINLGINLVGKAVLLSLPDKTLNFNYTVDAQASTVTVYNVNSIGVYMEVQVIDPTPLPRTGNEPLWDDLPSDARRSLVVAWSDMICNDIFKSQVNVEWDFDDQDTLYQKLIGFKSNCGNFKGADNDGRLDVPRTIPLQPMPLEPTPKIDPPVIPHDPPPPSCTDYQTIHIYEWLNGNIVTVTVNRSDFLAGADVASPTACKYFVKLVKMGTDVGVELLNKAYTGSDAQKLAGTAPYTDLIGIDLVMSDGTKLWISDVLTKSYAQMSNPNLIMGDKSLANGSSPHVALGVTNDYALFKFDTTGLTICSTNLASFSTPPPPPPPAPAQPPVDISHQYDVAFLLRWQDNSPTDLDLYGFVDHDKTKDVMYAHPKYTESAGTIWLDHDYTSHGPTGYKDQPEVISILDFASSVISIQVNNYNGNVLTENPVVEVIDNAGAVIKSYTIPAGMLSGGRSSVWVLDYDVKNKAFASKIKAIPATGTFQ